MLKHCILDCYLNIIIWLPVIWQVLLITKLDTIISTFPPVWNVCVCRQRRRICGGRSGVHNGRSSKVVSKTFEAFFSICKWNYYSVGNGKKERQFLLKCILFKKLCFAWSSIDTIWWYLHLMSAEVNLRISWKYQQIVSVEYSANHHFKDECTLT